MLWKFHVIPRPGEFGHETWENDAWRWTGDVSSWAPMSADPARGLVYIPTNGATIDYFGGFRPGDNLFGTSIMALDVKTGKRVWHQQMVKHDIWNYDTPTAPVLLDVNVGGQPHPGRVPDHQAVVGLLVQPVHRRADLADGRAARAAVEGARREALADAALRDQAGAVRPQGRTEAQLIDYTPEVKKLALERAQEARSAGAALRAARARGNAEGQGSANICPGGGGGANITGPPAADPESGIIFIASTSGCSPTTLGAAKQRDTPKMTGKTLAQWITHAATSPLSPSRSCQSDPLAGIPDLFKGPVGRITAIDMNTGEHLWMIPNGDMSTRDQEAVPQQRRCSRA